MVYGGRVDVEACYVKMTEMLQSCPHCKLEGARWGEGVADVYWGGGFGGKSDCLVDGEGRGLGWVDGEGMFVLFGFFSFLSFLLFF